MIDLRPVLYVIGRILIVLAILMVAPAIVDWRGGDPNAFAMAKSAMITGFVGVAIALATGNAVGHALDVRQAYLLTVMIWVGVPMFAALPFWLGEPRLSLLHGFFESVSGFTTTGATVLDRLETRPVGIHLWRGMLNWIGGLGIAFIAMIFLPLMRVGGMQFFRTEGFDTFGKALPRATDIARQLLYIYGALTVLCIMVYSMIGMPPLGAVVHGMASVATGGFSPYDTSFSGFQGLGEYLATIFMLLGSLPFVRYVQLVNGQPFALWRDAQVRAYLRWLLCAVTVVAVWRILDAGMAVEPAFRESLFNLTSIMSSTGFASGSFSSWDGLMLVVAFVVGTVGACSGSTASGLSVFRVRIAMSVLWRQVRQIKTPSSVDPVKFEGRTVEEDVINALVMFIAAYILILGLMSVAITLLGVDLESALFGAWTTLGNVGYGLGPLVEKGGGTFNAFPDGAIIIMTGGMILGRLGLMAILVLLLPAFWRR